MSELLLKIPSHVAIVMDGNGRWAKGRSLPRLMGHRTGMRNLERITALIKKYGVRYFSVYAFSTENWSRPQKEIEGLMSFFRYYIRRKVDSVYKEGGRIRFAGRRDRLPDDIVELMRETEERTKDAQVFDLILCVDYGGRTEILDAVNKIIASKTESVTEADLRSHLYLPDVPDPDLIIRTSGEFRTSNFWLWQGAYSEYYFTSTFWPAFDEAEFMRALESYSGRERRYGSVKGK